jgi:hypothetical protein
MKRSKGEFRGKYGDHITTVDLSKIPQHLKDAFIKEMGFTGAFHQAYYQSIIDLDDYTGRYVDEKYAGSSKKKKSILIKKMREAFLNGWIGTDPDLSYQVPMHTGRESIDFTNNVDPEQAMKSIGIRLKRHEPSAVSLANKIFLQVYPSNYAKPKSNSPKSITPKKAKRK